MSKFINGTNRNQLPLFASSIDDAIAQDNEIRLIDLFVDSLKLPDFGFAFDFVENGRPAYHPSDLLKLYMYGYLNRMRSSRVLEKECSRNIELMWLLKGLAPDHNTIANFRKDNPKAIARVFQSTVKMAAHFELIGGTLVAGDSTKLRAQNSKKNNFNPGKIERHIAYIDAKLEQYNAALAKEDGDAIEKEVIAKKIQKHTSQKQKYIGYQNTIDTTGVSAHAPDMAFDVEHFNYDKTTDSYTCPANQILTTNGNWYNKTNGKSITKMKHYKTTACLSCELFEKCTKNKKGRLIERPQHADLINENKVRIENNYEIYCRRQAIVEHPYGVIKRQWDFYYIMTKKTIKHATADVGLIFSAYNLRRIFNTIDHNLLKMYLIGLAWFFLAIKAYFKALCTKIIFDNKMIDCEKKYLFVV